MEKPFPPLPNIAVQTVVAEIHIQLIQQDGGVGLNVNSSADPLSSLGLLELAKDAFKNQQTAQKKSSLVIARPGLG